MFVVNDQPAFIDMLLNYGTFVVRAYDGPVPQPTDSIIDTAVHNQLAAVNTALLYDSSTKQLRIRLVTHTNGFITFVRLLNARDNVLAQYVPNNYATIPVVANSVVRINIPNITITITEG